MEDKIITYDNYDIKRDIEIDDWIYFENDSIRTRINKYAMFEKKLSEDFYWYQKNKLSVSNIKDEIIVFRLKDIIIGYVILNYYVCNNKYYLSLNPICVNPTYLYKGYGSFITKIVINDAEKMVDGKVDIISANTDITNAPCIAMLERLGFVIDSINDDGTFIDYQYIRKKQGE